MELDWTKGRIGKPLDKYESGLSLGREWACGNSKNIWWYWYAAKAGLANTKPKIIYIILMNTLILGFRSKDKSKFV